ncbi:MAG: hypothetical protein IK115_05885 [Lachnospiraceae bacterium]|nr:hypothetical protein [Lachnospiraceae bacterium]
MDNQYEYREAGVLSVEETLGIDREKSREAEKELSGLFGMEDMVEEQRAAVEMLVSTDSHIREYVHYYRKNKDRERVEKIYALKISILDNMAKRFHPFSRYGKKQLAAAADCRREFEKIIGPMISPVTKNNVDLFKTVLSVDLYEDILSGRRSALGALRTRNGNVYGVGAIAWYIDMDPFLNKPILRIDWLFVNEEFRERSVADFLMGELLAQLIQSGVENISAEFPGNAEGKEILAYFFGTWQFELGSGLSPEAVIRVGDITERKRISALSRGSEPLANFLETEKVRFIRHALGRLDYDGYLKEVPGEYIDKELSFYAGSRTDIRALLLAHRTASGMLRVEYLASAPEREKFLPCLIWAFIDSAIRSGDENTELMIPVEAEELGEILDKFCRLQLGQYLLSGTLNPPLREMDFDEDDIEKLLEATE